MTIVVQGRIMLSAPSACLDSVVWSYSVTGLLHTSAVYQGQPWLSTHGNKGRVHCLFSTSFTTQRRLFIVFDGVRDVFVFGCYREFNMAGVVLAYSPGGKQRLRSRPASPMV